MKTKVLLSSIFFIEDSVVRGYLMTEYASILSLLGTLFFGNLGALLSLRVLGRRNLTTVLTFFTRVPNRPLTVFFLAESAFAAAGVLATFFSGLIFLMVLGSFFGFSAALGLSALGFSAFFSAAAPPAAAFFFPSFAGAIMIYCFLIFLTKPEIILNKLKLLNYKLPPC